MRAASKIIIMAVVAILAGVAQAQVAVISGQAISQYGQPLPYAPVRICSVTASLDSSGNCTPTATIYQDYGLTPPPIGNPLTTDQYGNYVAYVGALAAPNLYQVQVYPNPGIIWTYVQNGPFLSASGGVPINATYFNATVSPYYEVNGVQLASTNLGDTGNIAYKNAANTFSGGTQTASIWNATGSFEVGGVQIACTNLSDYANLAKINTSNTFTGTTQTAPVFNASTGFQLAGTAPSNHVLLGNGTDYVDSSTIPYSIITGGPTAPFAGAGIPYATSTTASTVATSPQLVASLNNSPSTTLAAALLPLATSTSFGAVEPDNTSIRVTAGVISAVNGSSNRICNSDGCYRTEPDGTLVQWGSLLCSGTSCTITYPHAFTAVSSISFTATISASQSNLTTVVNTVTTTSAVAETGGVVFVGGSGGAYTGGGTYYWFAIGY